MKNSLKTASFKPFGWTILLIVLLACFSVVMMVSRKKVDVITSHIGILRQYDSGYRSLDTCISFLYDAENNQRLFVLTLDSAYAQQYTAQLRHVSEVLRRAERQQNRHTGPLPGLINRKREDTKAFTDLKIMVDSLLVLALQDAPDPVPARKPDAIRKTQEVVRRDTVHTLIKTKRKRLLKRIAEAIANKPAEDSLVSLEASTLITSDSVLSRPTPDEGKKMYTQLQDARRALNEREKQLLNTNRKIFAHMQAALRDIRQRQEQQQAAVKEAVLSATEADIQQVRDLGLGSVMVVILLALIIIWNLIRLYQKEVKIIRYTAAAEQETERKGAFLAQVAHEIRTPLNSVIGFSGLIDTAGMNETQKFNVASIRNASRILLNLVNELLDFSKFESRKITLSHEHINPEELLGEAMRVLSFAAEGKKIAVRQEYDFDKKYILIGDSFRIKQVVINLLTNAIKFTPEQGTVVLSASFAAQDEKGGQLTIQVKDSGPGIAPENQQRIFDDFVQVEMPDVSQTRLGTGLGLAICKRIVDLYHGSISVSSVPGQGALFTVAIPLNIAQEHFVSEPERRDVPGGLSGRRALLVDDVRMNLILLGRFLEKYGIGFDLASDGTEALGLFEKNNYDIIITDVLMPVMTGVELTKQIRQHTDTLKAGVPILAYTGSSADETQYDLSAAGMNGILPKPFEEQDLLQLLRKIFPDQ